MHTRNPSSREAEDLCELEASLVYRASSRTTRATQRNPVSNKQANKPSMYLHNFFFHSFLPDLPQAHSLLFSNHCCYTYICVFRADHWVSDNQSGDLSLGKANSHSLSGCQLLVVLHLGVEPREISPIYVGMSVVLELLRPCLGSHVVEVSRMLLPCHS